MVTPLAPETVQPLIACLTVVFSGLPPVELSAGRTSPIR